MRQLHKSINSFNYGVKFYYCLARSNYWISVALVKCRSLCSRLCYCTGISS